MQQFRDLKLIGNPNELSKLVEKIETSLCDGWIRAKDKEAILKNGYNSDQFVFLTPEDNSIPYASLHIDSDENGYLYICNIVPAEKSQLGKKNYNLILEKFLAKFVEPAVKDLDIRIVTTSAEKNINNSMSPELSEKLKRFSVCANKSTGCGHPCDQERFMDFIIQAHREGSLLDDSTLRGLLIDEGWSEYFADDLSSKYCFNRDVLKQYDS